MTPIAVRRAGPDDAVQLATILAVAFHYDPISCWLFPDEADRANRHPAFFQIFVAATLASGQAYTTCDPGGAALWLPHPALPHAGNLAATRAADPAGPHIRGPAGPQTTDPAGEQLAAACGPNLRRFTVLDELMRAAHPDTEHEYLAFIGVLPEQQGHGIGTALLRHRLSTLDSQGVPAYLEASSARNAAGYERLGFRPLRPPITLPADGPSLQPMWRPPM